MAISLILLNTTISDSHILLPQRRLLVLLRIWMYKHIVIVSATDILQCVFKNKVTTFPIKESYKQ